MRPPTHVIVPSPSTITDQRQRSSCSRSPSPGNQRRGVYASLSPPVGNNNKKGPTTSSSAGSSDSSVRYYSWEDIPQCREVETCGDIRAFLRDLVAKLSDSEADWSTHFTVTSIIQSLTKHNQNLLFEGVNDSGNSSSTPFIKAVWPSLLVACASLRSGLSKNSLLVVEYLCRGDNNCGSRVLKTISSGTVSVQALSRDKSSLSSMASLELPSPSVELHSLFSMLIAKASCTEKRFIAQSAHETAQRLVKIRQIAGELLMCSALEMSSVKNAKHNVKLGEYLNMIWEEQVASMGSNNNGHHQYDCYSVDRQGQHFLNNNNTNSFTFSNRPFIVALSILVAQLLVDKLPGSKKWARDILTSMYREAKLTGDADLLEAIWIQSTNMLVSEGERMAFKKVQGSVTASLANGAPIRAGPGSSSSTSSKRQPLSTLVRNSGGGGGGGGMCRESYLQWDVMSDNTGPTIRSAYLSANQTHNNMIFPPMTIRGGSPSSSSSSLERKPNNMKDVISPIVTEDGDHHLHRASPSSSCSSSSSCMTDELVTRALSSSNFDDFIDKKLCDTTTTETVATTSSTTESRRSMPTGSSSTSTGSLAMLNPEFPPPPPDSNLKIHELCNHRQQQYGNCLSIQQRNYEAIAAPETPFLAVGLKKPSFMQQPDSDAVMQRRLGDNHSHSNNNNEQLQPSSSLVQHVNRPTIVGPPKTYPPLVRRFRSPASTCSNRRNSASQSSSTSNNSSQMSSSFIRGFARETIQSQRSAAVTRAHSVNTNRKLITNRPLQQQSSLSPTQTAKLTLPARCRLATVTNKLKDPSINSTSSINVAYHSKILYKNPPRLPIVPKAKQPPASITLAYSTSLLSSNRPLLTRKATESGSAQTRFRSSSPSGSRPTLMSRSVYNNL